MINRRQLLGLVPAALWAGAPSYRDHQDLLYYLDDRGRHAVRSRKEWERRRAHILDGMQNVMGPMPARSGTPRMELVSETAEKGYSRRLIRYEAEPGDWVPAWLLVPPARRAPAVICLHQTTRIGKDEPAGLGGKPNLHYAKELALRGYVALAPDYPNFGEYKIDVYGRGYASATMKGILNHMRAVDLLVHLPFVEGRRIGACGHSLGGHNTLFLAAFDERVRVAVTSCGFTSFAKYFHGDLTGWSHKGYMPRIAEVYGRSAEKMPFDFPEVLAAIAPRALFINAPKRDGNFEVTGVADCVRGAAEVYGRVYGKAGALAVEYPDAEHDFPTDVRLRAYEFVGKVLRGRP